MYIPLQSTHIATTHNDHISLGIGDEIDNLITHLPTSHHHVTDDVGVLGEAVL